MFSHVSSWLHPNTWTYLPSKTRKCHCTTNYCTNVSWPAPQSQGSRGAYRSTLRSSERKKAATYSEKTLTACRVSEKRGWGEAFGDTRVRKNSGWSGIPTVPAQFHQYLESSIARGFYDRKCVTKSSVWAKICVVQNRHHQPRSQLPKVLVPHSCDDLRVRNWALELTPKNGISEFY